MIIFGVSVGGGVYGVFVDVVLREVVMDRMYGVGDGIG